MKIDVKQNRHVKILHVRKSKLFVNEEDFNVKNITISFVNRDEWHEKICNRRQIIYILIEHEFIDELIPVLDSL